MNKLKAILALTRWTEIYDYTLALTLLAAVFSGIEWQWRIIFIFFINVLGQCFAFMINDVEDAEDDALNPKKLKRNPVSNGSLSKKEGYLYAALAAFLCIILFAILTLSYNPIAVVIVAITTLVTMFLYSWKTVRFKSMPGLDFLSHIYMLAGAPYLLAYFSFRQEMDTLGLLGLIMVLLFSGYGIMENQLRDYETDKKTNIKNTTAYIGVTASKVLQILFILGGIAGGFYYIFTLPQKLFILVEVAIIAFIISLYPIGRYLFRKSKEDFKLDLHRALLFLGYILLIAKIFKLL